FRIAPGLEWTLAAEYDGWPNGIAIHRDGALWIADYRRGLLRWDGQGEPVPILARRNSESFRGLNDLTFDAQGNCYFTDQGQTGLHDPTGRVYRLRTDGRLDMVLAGIPSPNGIALNAHGRALLVAGSVSKVGAFRTFFGTAGPDGLAVDVDNRLVVAHASLGGAFVVNVRGEVTHFVKSPAGSTVTNVAYRPGTSRLVMTESETGTILEADLPGAGAGLYS